MALKLTKSLLLLASIVWFSDACCPEHWFQIGNKCYRFYGSPRRWNDALYECQRQPGGSLVSIHSYSENNMIYQAWKGLVRHPTDRASAYWIGLHDQESASLEGEFVWSDGSPKDYVNFKYGQPNNAWGEDCVHVYNIGDNDGERMKWNDLGCDNRQAFFCQKPLHS